MVSLDNLYGDTLHFRLPRFWATDSTGGCTVCLSGWNDPSTGCRCSASCSNGRGNCTSSGCLCYQDSTHGYFTGSAANGLIGAYSGDCALCLPPYTGSADPVSPCTCLPSTCDTVCVCACVRCLFE